MSTKVALLECKDYDRELVYNKIKEAISLIFGNNQVFKKGEKVLLKPNLLAPDPPEKSTTTHPVVFESIARILLENDVKVYYGDSPAFHKLSKTAEITGIADVAQKLNLILADFESGKKVIYKNAVQNKVFEIAKGVLEVDGIISLPKLKTHGLTLMTGAIKNQFGCIPGKIKAGLHAKLEDLEKFSQMLVDLTTVLRPRLYVMDAIYAMEGNGPRRGHPVNLGVLLVSTDPVAIDAIASQIIGLNPKEVLTTIKGFQSGLGNIENITILGEDIYKVSKKFALPRYRGNYNLIPSQMRKIIQNYLLPRPVINYKKCKRCYECYKICPTTPKSIEINENKLPEHNYKTCIRCYCCQETCPEGAITIKLKFY